MAEAGTLHTRLLAHIDEYAVCRGREEWFCVLGEAPPLVAALRAVVELHKPEQHYTVDQKGRSHPSRLYCRTCRATSPCSTIQVIARELGDHDAHDLDRDDVHEIIQVVLTATWQHAVAEGRRQATEGWEREWGVAYGPGRLPDPADSELIARRLAGYSPERTVSRRLVGPWEPAPTEPPDPLAPSVVAPTEVAPNLLLTEGHTGKPAEQPALCGVRAESQGVRGISVSSSGTCRLQAGHSGWHQIGDGLQWLPLGEATAADLDGVVELTAEDVDRIVAANFALVEQPEGSDRDAAV